MGIENVGESLLTAARQRTKENEKRQRNALYAGMAGKLIGKIGNAYLESQATKFMNNEKTLQERLAFKNAYSTLEQTQQRQKQAETYEGGYENYWTDQALAESQPFVQQYLTGKDPGQVKRLQGAWAQTRARELQTQHKQLLEASEKFKSEGALSSDTYEKFLRKQNPTTLSGKLSREITTLFEGDTEANDAEAIKELGYLKTAEQINAFDEAFKQTKNANVSLSLSKMFKSQELRDTPPTQKVQNVTRTNSDGEQVTETAILHMKNGELIMTTDLKGNPLSDTDTSRSFDQRILASGVDRAYQVQTLVNEFADDSTKDNLESIYEARLGNIDEDSPANKQLLDNIRKGIYGAVGLVNDDLKTRFGFSEEIGIPLAAKKIGLTYETKEKGFNLVQTESGFSAVLTLAALEDFYKEGVFDLDNKQNAQFVAGLVQSEEFERNFDSLTRAQKTAALEWMEDYRILSKSKLVPTRAGNMSVTDYYLNKHNLKPQPLENDKDKNKSPLTARDMRRGGR